MIRTSHQVCLCMMVRDEAHVIERALRSAFGFADFFIVLDTGSTDNTIMLVRAALAGRPHKVVESTWKGFTGSRNEALALARPHGQYIVFLDADDFFVGNVALAKQRLSDSTAWMCFAFQQWLRHAKLFAVNRDLDVQWSGQRHEFLSSPRQNIAPQLSLMRDLSVRYTHEGYRSSDPNVWLNDAMEINPVVNTIAGCSPAAHSRNLFYLARTFQMQGDLSAAELKFFERASYIGADEEERWFAELCAVRLLEIREPSDPTLPARYANLMVARDTRAEVYLDLARQLRMRGRFEEALELARQSPHIGVPDDWIDVDTGAHSVFAWDEQAANLFELKRWAEAARLWRRALSVGSLSIVDRSRMRAAVDVCAAVA
jgi:glycosyltransferase involved in cell wall biosynthesis